MENKIISKMISNDKLKYFVNIFLIAFVMVTNAFHRETPLQ